MMLGKDCVIDGDKITIFKQTIEEWLDHYVGVYKSMSVTERALYYKGKADVFKDFLKQFGNG